MASAAFCQALSESSSTCLWTSGVAVLGATVTAVPPTSANIGAVPAWDSPMASSSATTSQYPAETSAGVPAVIATGSAPVARIARASPVANEEVMCPSASSHSATFWATAPAVSMPAARSTGSAASRTASLAHTISQATLSPESPSATLASKSRYAS